VTVLRLAPIRGQAIGRWLAAVDAATLVRRGADVYLDILPADAGAAVRELALAGISAQAVDTALDVPRHLAVGIGVDLTPLAGGLGAFDVVRVERVPLGVATAEVLRRRLERILPPNRRSRDRCRALLRGGCVMFRWGRRVWASRGALRGRSARASIRPVVFDRASLEHWELTGWTCTCEGALAQWAFH
jgi:hypothetical protein